MPQAPSTGPAAALRAQRQLQAALARLDVRVGPQDRLVVAYSGGADSTALLLAAVRQWPQRVSAVHVNHQLQAAAAGFEAHCRAWCARLQVPLQVLAVQARPAPGQSPEDAARRARYQAISEALGATPPQPLVHVLLAQHADDQLETILLALSRGAGLPGLAAMPAWRSRDGLHWHRPLLELPGEVLRLWLRAQGVAWIEDPSNADERFTRNRIRARVLPALLHSFPQARETFARSARHAAQAQAVLHEVAVQDLELIGRPPRLAALRALSRARQANVLRHWLSAEHAQQASSAQMDELLDQIAAARTRGHRLRLKVGTGWVQRQGDLLDWYNP